jgi:hypothetical protein
VDETGEEVVSFRSAHKGMGKIYNDAAGRKKVFLRWLKSFRIFSFSLNLPNPAVFR